MLNIDDRLIKEVSPKIGPNALSTLLAIAIHLNQKTNRCFPSHHRLMELTGMGRDAVYTALSALQKHGLLTVEQRIDSKKKQFTRRTFRVSTRFISVFVNASDLEPLPENPYPARPYPGEPDTGNQETYQINNSEPVNYTEQINKLNGESHSQKNETTGPTWRPPNPDQEISEMLADELCVERFFRQINAPISEFPAYASRFILKIKSEGATHSNRKDFRSHFFSWARLEHERDEKNKKNGLKFNSPDTISDALDFAKRWQRETELGLPH
ncbi:MAG: helix-turn-helix domain-containing protein [Candidatus Obscuribacter sp.]|nr:helix-turn-helix domain-containing protein [Candidatus Obscuribacter sp.]